MKETAFQIGQVPAILYGEKADRIFLFVHGKHGCKEGAKPFAEAVCPKGWQVLAMDLPEHGARQGGAETLDPWHVVPELEAVRAYILAHWTSMALRADSIGAWFSMLAFGDTPLEQCLFVSPVLDMAALIRRMMAWAGVTEAELEARGTIPTDFGETLSWAYYQYAMSHPIARWDSPTAILYAGQDHLTRRQEAEAFASRFRCGLTVMEEGEHWFHTPEQLDFLARWTDAQTTPPEAAIPQLTAEECLFFAGRPEALTLYETLRGSILAEFPQVRVKVQKTQITFAERYGFAFVSRPRRKGDRGILLSFGLSHRQESPRIQYASEPYPGRWTHHAPVRAADEIDEELLGWLREAHWFAGQK